MYMQALTDMTYYMGVTSLIETEVFMEDIAPSKHRYVCINTLVHMLSLNVEVRATVSSDITNLQVIGCHLCEHMNNHALGICLWASKLWASTSIVALNK